MLYEILIRGREDGTFAAHVVDYVDDGTDANGNPRRTIGAPRPVAVADVGTLIGAENARLLAALATAERERDEARAESSAAPSPAPIAMISRPQCAAELLARGMITAAEAVAMATAANPPPMVAEAFAAMPADQRDFAKIAFAEANYRRNHPVMAGILAATGATEADIDAFFAAAAAR